MLDYYNDSTIKIEYDPQSNKTAFDLTTIGTDAGETITAYSGITPTDSNTIYVSDTVGNDTTGDGTSALPYKTILKGINSCTVTKIYVIILDSVTYSEDLTTVNNDYFTELYANTGETPILSRRVLGYTPTDSNSIFVNATTGNDSTGDGSAATPYATITKGAAECDATHQKVVITDSSTYTDGAIEFTGNFLGLYAQIGQAPTWDPDKDSTFISTTDVKSQTAIASGNIIGQASAALSSGNVVQVWRDSSGNGQFIIYDSVGSVEVSQVQFDTNILEVKVAGLTGGGFAIIYRDVAATSQAQVVIYSNAGALLYGPSAVTAINAVNVDIASLNNGNFAIIYRLLPIPNGVLYYQVYSSTLAQIKAQTTVEAAGGIGSVTGMSNNNFAIHYQQIGTASGGPGGQFVKIYTNAGTLLDTITVQTGNTTTTSYIAVSSDSDSNIVIAYSDYAGSRFGMYAIYDSDGNTVKALSAFYAFNSATSIQIKHFSNDNFIITFRGNSNSGYYQIYTSVGSLLGVQVAFNTTFHIANNVAIFLNDYIFIAYQVGSTGQYFKIYNFQGYYLIKNSAASTLNGIKFTTSDANNLGFMIKSTANIEVVNCEIEKLDNTLTAYAIYSGSDITAQFCSVHENGAGFYTVADTSTIQDSIFYLNSKAAAIHIDGAAASSGDITIEHCTIFNNNAGIKLENNNGTNEILKNLIIHNNAGYGIEADTTVTYTNSANTDTLSGASAGASVLLTNPLFINEGVIDPDDADLNLRSSLLGYTTSSPAINLGDDDRDAGGYNRIIIGSITTWTAITLPKPIRGFNIWTEPVQAVKNVRRDGSIGTSRVALTEYVEITFTGIVNADYIEALALLQTTNSQVRIYPDPTTNPNDFNIYKYVYQNINGSPAHYRLARTGKENIKLLFARATT